MAAHKPTVDQRDDTSLPGGARQYVPIGLSEGVAPVHMHALYIYTVMSFIVRCYHCTRNDTAVWFPPQSSRHVASSPRGTPERAQSAERRQGELAAVRSPVLVLHPLPCIAPHDSHSCRYINILNTVTKMSKIKEIKN